MKVRDPQELKKLMEIQDVSLRELARSAGWSSHTYLMRILNGQIKSVQPTPAARIAKRLGVGVDHLFLTRLTGETVRNTRQGRAA